jgi:uncharacterized protein DUF222
MHQLTRPHLDAQAVQTAEQLLTEHAVILAPAVLRRFAHAVVNAADPDGPEPVDDQLQQDRRYLELKQRRDGMWHLAGRLSNTVGTQLNVILDPLTKPRSTAIEDDDGTVVDIPDQRPQVQRLHDALDEACARLLKAADQPSVGGIPASVVVTISLEDLLAKAALAETADGSQLTSDQLLRIADEAEIWPTIIDRNGVPLALGRSRRLASHGQTMALIARDAGCSFPGCTHPPDGATGTTFWTGSSAVLLILTISPCSVGITTPTSCRKAGAAASTPTDSPNGSRPNGSTKINNPTSTIASNASTPNANSTTTTDTADGKTPHDHPARSRPSTSPIGAALAHTSAANVLSL